MTAVYPRETVEFLPVNITVDGAPVTSGVELSRTFGAERPTLWETPTSLGGKIGILLTAEATGYHTVWARITSAPETPVINAGTYLIN